MAIIKDWVCEAALDIQRISNPTIVEICDAIEKHLPFKKGVPYMPVPRCDGCKHWKQRHVSMPEGKCDNPDLSIYDVETLAGFGCVMWEKR